MPYFRFLAILSMVSLSGCALAPQRIPYSSADLAAARVSDGEDVRFWADENPSAYQDWIGNILAQRRTSGQQGPQTLLALSGGSDKGAFSAGLLGAWSKRGDRPEFDIVTGVSTGALIAPFAFLGAGRDDEIRSIYTGIDSKDIYRPRVLSGLLGGSSLLETRPLKALIARHITLPFLDQIAEQHRRGRRLLVLTTNLDAQRGVVWDMGAIAAGRAADRLVLFRQILLASASVPGAFPPVLIQAQAHGRHFAEMHVDGGTVSGFFVMPRTMLSQGLSLSPPSMPNRGGIYLLYNGRIAPDFNVVKPKTFTIVSHALSTVLGQLDRTNIEDMRGFAKENRIGFTVCAIDDRFKQASKSPFERGYMRALYDFGASVGADPHDCLAPSDTSQTGDRPQ